MFHNYNGFKVSKNFTAKVRKNTIEKSVLLCKVDEMNLENATYLIYYQAIKSHFQF